MKILFDIKYRPQIESGEYKVETSAGNPARIICWDAKLDFPIVVLLMNRNGRKQEWVDYYSETGETSDHASRLVIITPDPELTPFEKCLSELLGITPDDGRDGLYNIQEGAKELLKLAYKGKNIPTWKTMGAGAMGSGNPYAQIYLVKNCCGYNITTSVVAGDEYLLLSDLEELPHE